VVDWHIEWRGQTCRPNASVMLTAICRLASNIVLLSDGPVSDGSCRGRIKTPPTSRGDWRLKKTLGRHLDTTVLGR